MSSKTDSRIFVSYSHRGDGPKWRAKLLRALKLFEQQHLLDVWQDGNIRVSAFWDDDIKQAMTNARVAVVLLTKDALDPRTSDDPNYILDTEFPVLRKRQQAGILTVFPVVCEDCNWRAHDWLRATQAPNNSNPLAQLSEAEQDYEFSKLATNIAEEISRIALAENSTLRTSNSELKTFLDKFPLTRGASLREEKLIGREQELALLDLAFTQPHTAIVSLVAWGGVGKTMLVQHWLQHLQREGWFGARRIYAWSFYSQGTNEDRQASEDIFLAHALEWLGVQCEPTLSPWDKGRLIADAVARERTLLILDGIEPLQYPPGPMGGQLRAPGVQSLLKQLARKAAASINSQQPTVNNTLCLVTTREPLTDLADFQRRPDAAWGSVLRVDLGNLTEEAGAALLHHAGANRAGAAEIKPDDKELLAASREVDGHALTLNLLGRFLARAHGGDVRRRDLVKFEEADRKEQGGTTFKMLAAFENWFAKGGQFGARQLAVLRILGLFDRPADAGCIDVLLKTPSIRGITEGLFDARIRFAGLKLGFSPITSEDWNHTLFILSDFRVIAVWPDDNSQGYLLDCHPLIREYFAKQLVTSYSYQWQAAHLRLYRYLEENTEHQPDKRAGIQSLYEAVAHACKAQYYQHACDDILRDRIRRGGLAFNLKQLGDFSSDLTAIASFFERPWTQTSSKLTRKAQSWLLNESAYDLRALGRLSEAIHTVRMACEMSVREKNWKSASKQGVLLSELELVFGLVTKAKESAFKAIELADRSKVWYHQIISRASLADSLHQAGDYDQALAIFGQAEDLWKDALPEKPPLSHFYGMLFCNLFLAKPERAAWQRIMNLSSIIKSGLIDKPSVQANECQLCHQVKRRIAELSSWLKRYQTQDELLVEGILDSALKQLLLARSDMFLAIFGEPLHSTEQSHRKRFNAVVALFRHANEVDILPLSLLSRAWLLAFERDLIGAQTDLDEAWDIAERGPMRLHMADIHLHRARLFFREKNYPWKSPQADLAAAEKLINECGYHRRDQELADAKRAILGNLR